MRTRGVLLLLVLLLAGCATQEGPPGGADGHVSLPRAALNATAGRAVTFPVVLGPFDGASVDVHLRGALVQGTLRGVTPPIGANKTVFVTVQVPAEAQPGAHPLALLLTDAAGKETYRREAAATVQVVAGGGGYAPGDVGRVVYAGRLAESGQTFNTNDPVLQPLAFAKTPDYSFSSIETLSVTSLPTPSVVPGFHEAVLGMVPGESRTVTFPAEKGYGNATTEERFPREDVIERRQTTPLPEAHLPAAEFRAYLAETGQGVPEDYGVGDVVVNERDGRTLRYRIVEKTDEAVHLRMAVVLGERYTIYDMWTNGSEVEELNETHVTLYTTPTGAEGEPFTYYPYWPDFSHVASVDEARIVVRHDPPMGLQFTRTASPYAPPSTYTVTALDEEEIVATTPSSNPLAGKALTFDITMAGLEKGGNAG